MSFIPWDSFFTKAPSTYFYTQLLSPTIYQTACSRPFDGHSSTGLTGTQPAQSSYDLCPDIIRILSAY